MNAKAKQAMFNLRDDLKRVVPTNPVVVVNRSDLEEAVSYMFHDGEEWNNQSAYGYAIAAAESMELSKESIEGLVAEMRFEFDEMTLEEAADVYRKSNY